MKNIYLNDAYTLFYPPGGFGTFFVYFISLHKNFHTYKLKHVSSPFFIPYVNYDYHHIDIKEERPVHCGIESIDNEAWPDLVWKKVELPERNQLPVMTLKEYFKKFNEAFPESVNKKLIIKQIPHARQVMPDHANLKSIIFDSDNWEWLTNRNKENFKSFNTEIEAHREVIEKLGFLCGNVSDWYKLDKLSNDLNNYDASYCFIDICQLLKLSNSEYNKLLKYIDEPPLQNWKTVISNFLEIMKIDFL